MKAYRVSGRFKMGDRWQDFTKEVAGEDDERVKEVVFSILGSKHRVRRSKIQITDVKEIAHDEVKDPVTKYQLESSRSDKKKQG
ncbi:MAG: 50S ribosomal protein L18a [Thermoplasmata archaeon]|nr:MAG: 50S ribosomal protein L18a [Thermoplasmata archaeon]